MNEMNPCSQRCFWSESMESTMFPHVPNSFQLRVLHFCSISPVGTALQQDSIDNIIWHILKLKQWADISIGYIGLAGYLHISMTPVICLLCQGSNLWVQNSSVLEALWIGYPCWRALLSHKAYLSRVRLLPLLCLDLSPETLWSIKLACRVNSNDLEFRAQCRAVTTNKPLTARFEVI